MPRSSPPDPDDLYTMVADITRTGERSPACTGGQWVRAQPRGRDPGSVAVTRAGTHEWTRAEGDGWLPWSRFRIRRRGRRRRLGSLDLHLLAARRQHDCTQSWEVLRIVPHMGETDDQLRGACRHGTLIAVNPANLAARGA
jgi:hypothetical protein